MAQEMEGGNGLGNAFGWNFGDANSVELEYHDEDWLQCLYHLMHAG